MQIFPNEQLLTGLNSLFNMDNGPTNTESFSAFLKLAQDNVKNSSDYAPSESLTEAPYSSSEDSGLYSFDEVSFTKTELFELHQSLIKGGAAYADLDKLRTLLDKPDGANISQILKSLTPAQEIVPLSDNEQLGLSGLLAKIDPTGGLENNVSSLLESGQGFAAWSMISEQLTSMNQGRTIDVDKDEMAILGKALGLSEKGNTLLLSGFGSFESLELSPNSMKKLLSPAQADLAENSQNEAKLQKALETTLGPILKKANDRWQEAQDAASLRSKTAQHSSILIQDTVTKDARTNLEQTVTGGQDMPNKNNADKNSQTIKGENVQTSNKENVQTSKIESVQTSKSENGQTVKVENTHTVKVESTQTTKNANGQISKTENIQITKSENIQISNSGNTQPVKADNAQPVKVDNAQPVKADNAQPIKVDNAPSPNAQVIASDNNVKVTIENPLLASQVLENNKDSLNIQKDDLNNANNANIANNANDAASIKVVSESDTSNNNDPSNNKDANWDSLLGKVEVQQTSTKSETSFSNLISEQNASNTPLAEKIMHDTQKSTPNPRYSESNIANQVEKGLLSAMKNGSTKLELQLNPGDLGAITLILTSSATGEISASIRSDRSETAEVMQRQLEVIRVNLEQQGIKVDKLEVQYESSDKQQGDAWKDLEQHNNQQEQNARQQQLERLRNLRTVRNSTTNSENSTLERNMHIHGITENNSATSLHIVA